jgi:hypothetical protein
VLFGEARETQVPSGFRERLDVMALEDFKVS